MAEEVATYFSAQLGERFTWMDRSMVDVGGVIVLGCTLHSRIDRAVRKQVRKEIPDFSYVGGWDIDKHNEAREHDRTWLKQQLAMINKTRPDSRVIVATHFPPTWDKTSDSKYTQKGRPWKILSDGEDPNKSPTGSLDTRTGTRPYRLGPLQC